VAFDDSAEVMSLSIFRMSSAFWNRPLPPRLFVRAAAVDGVNGVSSMVTCAGPAADESSLTRLLWNPNDRTSTSTGPFGAGSSVNLPDSSVETVRVCPFDVHVTVAPGSGRPEELTVPPGG